MKVKATWAVLTAFIVMAFGILMPLSANAQNAIRHRQQTKNTWRNLAIAGGALGALGLITHHNTLGILGIAGGLYSLNRYEQDRKSQSRMERRYAELYSHRSINYNGHRYVRRTVWRHGHKYFQFVRG